MSRWWRFVALFASTLGACMIGEQAGYGVAFGVLLVVAGYGVYTEGR